MKRQGNLSCLCQFPSIWDQLRRRCRVQLAIELLNWSAPAVKLLKLHLSELTASPLFFGLLPVLSGVISHSVRRLSFTPSKNTRLFIYYDSCVGEVLQNCGAILPDCDEFTSDWDQVRRCCAVYLVRPSTGAIQLWSC